ncbi:MAG: hypothetical protein IPN79_08105 [Saprospiraceae bacterium]|nr:hypothetical protein [Saprospiraceae bacterium]
MKTKNYKILILLVGYFLCFDFNPLSGQQGVGVKVLMEYAPFAGNIVTDFSYDDKRTFTDRSMAHIELEKQINKRYKAGLLLGYGNESLKIPFNFSHYDTDRLTVNIDKMILAAGFGYKLDNYSSFYMHYGLCFYKPELNGSLINDFHGAETILSGRKLHTKTDDFLMMKFEFNIPVRKNLDCIISAGGRYHFKETIIEEFLEYDLVALFGQLGLRYTVF